MILKIGVVFKKSICGIPAHHHPKFDIDEEVLWIGSAVFAQAVFDLCNQRTGYQPYYKQLYMRKL